MASFSEWSNKKKQGQTEGTAQTGAQSFSAWSNQKLGKEEPVMPQTYRSQNTAHERSGLTRDEFDSRVRENYAQRAAQENRRTTSGGFYSQPTFGADAERLQTNATTAQQKLESKQKELEDAAAIVTEAERGMGFVESHMNQLYSSYQSNPTQHAADLFNKAYGMYETRLGEYNTAVDSFNSLYAEYEPLLSEYNAAAGAYNDYITGQQQAYSDWKGTIRSAEDIQADIAAQDSQIAALEQQQKDLNTEAAQLMNKVSGRRGGYQQLMEWSQQAAALRGQAAELDTQITELEEMKTLLAEELEWADYFRYADLTQNEDFAELSKYVSTETGEEPVFNAWSGMYTDTGFADVNYDIINRNETAKSRQGVTNISTNASFLGLDNSERGQMTDEEIAIFNYLYAQDTARGDAEHSTAYGYIDYLTGDLNYRQRQADEAQWAAYAAESPVGSSIFSILESPLKGLSYIGQIADYAEDGKIDQNAGYNKFSYLNSAIRNEVSDIVEEKWGGVGTFAYQTGMSMGDFLFNTAVSGGNQAVALTIMGSGAAADGTIRAKDRGLTDDQAFALGTIAGAAEIITEKLSLDALLDATKLGKSAFGYFVQNTVVEGAEEVGADFINLFADIMIAKDKSEWQQSIDAYIAQGCDEDTAFWNAFTDQAINMGLDFLGGAISGATFAGAAIGGNQVTTALDNRRQQRQQTAEQMQQRAAELQPQEQTEGIVLPTAEEAMGEQTVQQEPVQRQNTVQQNPVQQTVQTQEPGMLPTAEQAELNTQRRRAMEAATTELERSGIEAGVDTETIQQAQRISQAIGRDIVFYNEAATVSGIRNGYYSPADGKIHVNSQSQNPLAQIISHELTHSVELAESYGELSDIVLRRIQQTTDLQQLRQQKMELYARNGVELQNEAEIDQEIVAEYVERYLLTDERSIMELTRENRTLGERILRWINDLLAKLGNAGARERAFLTQARDTYARALSQTSFTEQTATAAPQTNTEAQNQGGTEAALRALREAYANGEITEEEFDAALDVIMEEEGMADQTMLEKNSFGGVNANGANLETLRQAQEMERQGVAAETIFRQTGWYTGADGKWRFELDDSRMEYHPGGDAQFSQNHPEYAEHQSLMQKLFNGDITEAEHDRLMELDEIWGREFGRLSERVERGNATLGDILQHDELFRAYPQLRKTRVRFEQMEPGTRGSYDPENDIITLNSELSFNTEATLIHEVQHAIQKAEGFARGSSTEYWSQPRTAAIKPEHRAEIEAAQEEVERWERRFADEWGEGSINLTLAQRYVELIEQLSEPGDSTAILQELENIDALVEESGWDDLLTGYAGARAELSLKKAAALRNRFDSYTAYRNTAGEIEARDVAERQTLTAEERRETMPNTGDENTLFVEENGEDGYFSMSADEQAGIREQLRENQDRLNAMEVVGSVNTQEYAGLDTRRAREKLVAEMKKTGYKVDRQGFGEIRFEESEINNSLNYKEKDPSAEDARRTGFLVLQSVLKRGIEIDGHGDHKGRNYDTVTIAAPVEINGKRGNMAVVVKRTKGNRYKVHRILTPEGGTFTLPEMANAEVNTVGAVTNDSQSLGGSAPAISSASETSITENGLPVKEKFSITEPVEQTETLLALHNMTEEKLRYTLNLGAWPAPSVAIVQATQGHEGYGEYSAVFPRSTIDPQADSRNRVYGSDAWTPTHSNAQVEYEVNYDVKRRFDDMVSELTRDFAGGALHQSAALGTSGIEDVTTDNIDKVAEKLSRKESVQAAYLASTGEVIEPIYRAKKFDSLGNELLQQYIDSIGVQELASIMVELETTSEISDETFEAVREIFLNDWIARNERVLNRKPELKEKRIEVQRSKFERYRAEKFVRNAWDYYEDGGTTTGEIDKYATAEKVTNRLSELSPDGSIESIERMVQDWVRGEIEGLLGEPGIFNGRERFDSKGNRKSFQQLHYPLTAENIVRAMYEQGKNRGEGLWGANAEGMVSVASPEYGSVEEIHADETRLRTASEDEYDSVMRRIDSEIGGFIYTAQQTMEAHSENASEEGDIIGYVLLKAAGSKNAQEVRKVFQREGYDLPMELAQRAMDIYQMASQTPTKYFEAKPERVVEFDEAVAVVAPDDAPIELLAAMRNAGMNVVEYEAGNEQSRLDTINNLEGVKFSISERQDKQEIIQNLRGILNRGGNAAELRRYVDTLDGYTEPEADTDAAAELVRTAHNEGLSVDEYLRQNWESYEYDGELNETARQALELEKRQGRRRYSVSEEADGQTDDTISTLPVKAQQYLRRTERYLLDKVSALLSVPRYAQREFLQDIVRDISTEYLQTGTVSQQTIDDLFERAYDEGIEVDSEYYDTYKGIKDHLRTQPITLAEQDKTNIADWGDFRKSTFGTLRIVNDGGLPVDVAYMELQNMAPELFPEDIIHPADQLVRMFEVGRSIQRAEKSLDEVYGHDAEEFKRWAKNDFDAAVNEVLGELRQVKRFADERVQQTETESALTQEQVAAMYGQLKDARRTYEKAAAKNLLTQHDEIQVGRLLRGEIELEHLDPAKDNIKGITAVYEAKQEYERLTRSIREWNQSRKAKLRETADGLLETANDWKDKKAGILYSRETMERNIRDIVKDSALAERIIAEYFKPVHDAQAEATRMKNKYRERVLALNLSRKVAKGNTVSEAHAVQLLGEAEDCIRMLEQSKGKMQMRDGKTLSDWRGIVSALWSENPKLDKAKIEAAVKEFRSIYDELFRQMNESRVRNGYEPVNYRSGYFPHFQPGDSDGILGQFGKALGIDMDVSALPTTINGLTHTFKPGIQWFGNAQERLGFNTAYDAVEGFDRYIEGVADVVHQTDNIQKLRALATQTRYRTGDEGIRKQVDAVMADTTLSETDKQNRIEKIYETGRYALSNFVVELEEYTNLLANKKSRADRNMEQALGRRMYELMKKLESRVAANMVAINPASWLTNFIPLTQGNALLDRGMLLHGMWDTLKAYKTDDGIVAKSTFLTNRRGSDPIVKTWAQAASAKMSSPMEHIDQFTADSLVRARYRQNIKKGLSEDAAMSEADSWVAGVMADRSKGSTPTLFNRSNPVTKVFTQFQLEVNNQLGYLFKDMPRDAREKGLKVLAAALLKFFLGAYLYNEIYEYVIGRRPALDPLGILNDTVGDITGYELPNLVELGVGAVTGDMPSFEVEKKNAYGTAEGLATAVAEELPFVGGILGGGRVPISSALPDWANLGKAFLNDEWSAEKRLATGLKELGNPATYLALPFGGGQIKKIYQGIKAVIEGGSYSVDSEGNDILQYPVYRDDAGQTALSTAGALLFGKSSLPTGRDWVESGFKSLGAKETACYQAMMDAGIGGEEAFGLLQELRGAEKTDTESESTVERGILRDSDIPGEGKSIVYYGLMASDKERELMDALADNADMGEVTSVLMEIKDAGNLTGAEASNAKREAIMDAALTDDEKKLVYRYMMGTKQEDGSYASSRDDDIMAFEQAGMDFDQFLQAQNEYSTINEEYSGAGDKAMEFSRWVNSQTLTAEQADTMRDCFKYYSQIPQEAARYNDFVAAGLDDDTAYELANTLNGLEPLEGEDTVSGLQRYRAVVDAGLTEDEQMTVLSGLMTESEYGKLQTGYSFGVTPAAYVTYKELLPQYDADGNGSFKQEEVEAAIDALGTGGGGIMLPSAGAPSAGNISLTNAEKAALWQMANKSWKPKNNPYDTYVGQQVYDALNAEPDTGGLQLPSQSEEEGGIQLPTAGSSLKLPSQG